MKTIVALVALAVFVNGLPQYHYPRPGGPGKSGSRPTNGGAPVSLNKGVTGNKNTGHNGYKYERPGANGQVMGGQFSGSQISGGQVIGSGEQVPRRQTINGQISGGYLPSEQEQYGEQQGKYGSKQGVVHGEAVIHKHVYVHVPPPELEEEQIEQRPVSAGRPEKHYKIIFIKAPAPVTPAAAAIPLQATKEEKTLVYVLVKKPEDAQEVTLATPEPTQPSKPEVFFIRYKSAKGEVAQEGGVQQGGYQEEGIRGQVSEGQTSVQAGAVDTGLTGGSSYLPPNQRKSAISDSSHLSLEHDSTSYNHQY